ncbi:ABC transporter permease subunit [Micromonospora purpureochromogenes]|uniref:ABC transporter permease subunit n=1 Tax=Micromonospora purpureochromogenes TaxID=47872 RepID=UPI00362D60FA
MIWMSWRQFRAQALAGIVALALLTAYLLHLGLDIREARDGYLAQCRPQGDCTQALAQFATDYENLLLFLAGLLGLVPALLGMFWGTPLIARELEAGTHRLVWNQSVTRRRWLLVKLLVVGIASMVAAGLASLLLTWAASPVDAVADARFSTVVFGARNIAPIAYAAFAFVLGAVVGLLTRRTLPAMAMTMLAILVIQFAEPNLVRPHLMPPVTIDKAMTEDAINEARGLGSITNGASVKGLTIPDAWVTDVSDLRTSDGRTLDSRTFDDCLSASNDPAAPATGRFGAAARCLGDLNLHVAITYQPYHRYWPFQVLESGLYLLLAGLLTLFGLWRIQRRTT